MADFKKLSDVEVVAEPSESANVLIEENGIIKKAPKTAVGGNSDIGLYHVVVRYDQDSGEYTSDFTYDELYALMEAGAFLYATIEEKYGNDYITATHRGYYYCSHYAMPDSDVIYFYRLEGTSCITFYGSNAVSVS